MSKQHIPEGWKTQVLGDLGYTFNGLTGKTKVDFGEGKPFIPYMNIFANSKVDKNFMAFVSISSDENQSRIEYGDILLTTSSETPEEVGMSSVVLDELPETYLNSFSFGFRLHNFDSLLPEYGRYLFRGEEVRKTLSVLSQGSTRFNLSKTALLRKLHLLLPSLPEQRKIAEILSTVDEKMAVIDEQLVQTQELKKGLMQRLLTRGIGHSAFKDSPLGEIPESWKISLLDSVAKRGSGHTPSKGFPEYYDGSIKWISLGDSNKLDKGWIKETKTSISPLGIKNSSAVQHPKGTVLLSRDAGVGKSAVMYEDMAVSQHFITWNCSESLNNWFLYYFLQMNKSYFERIAAGSTIKTIGLPFFKKLLIPVPPILEQELIAEILTTLDDKLQVLTDKKAQYQELKRGLMQQLLTGQRRVRVAAELATVA